MLQMLIYNIAISMINNFKVALIQNAIHPLKSDTLAHVKTLVAEAAGKGSKVCILGECFNSYYAKAHLQKNAEDFSAHGARDTFDLIQKLSEEFRVLIIGSVPELCNTKMYNTALCFLEGKLLSTYRKTHLFDIDIPGKITYMESQTFAPGEHYSILDTQYGKFGIGICYDIRFPEFAQAMREKGCHFLVYPGAFNMTTGPIHWELLLKARAVDYQVYFAGVSAARYKGDDASVYVGWGHSTLVDPMGKILCKLEENPGIVYSDVDLDYVHQIRQQIPVSAQRRKDLYELINKHQ